MKIKRHKKVYKNLAFFVNNFKFRQPYQILVDGTFCFAALNNKINIADNIPRYLQGEIKLLTTPCAVIEMENLGAKLTGALIVLKQYAVHQCQHKTKPVLGSECILSMLGKTNDSHYIVATQDRDLQSKVRNVPGVPLLYLHIKTPVLEEPSEASKIFLHNKMSGLLETEVKALQELKKKSGLIETKHRKKKKKQPNPLSCLKKKKRVIAEPVKKDVGKIERKKRKKIRLPEHVKQEILKNKTSS